jgi:hypothetical protein
MVAKAASWLEGAGMLTVGVGPGAGDFNFSLGVDFG